METAISGLQPQHSSDNGQNNYWWRKVVGSRVKLFSVFWNELKWVLMRLEIDIWKGIKNIKELSGTQTLTISYKVMLYKEITYRVDRKAICVQTGQTL